MTLEQKQFLLKAASAAQHAGHVFPEMAACEAALESAWGKSGLATEDNNLFGMKQHRHPIYGTHVLPTKEFVGLEKDTEDGLRDGWIAVKAQWVKYPDCASCFADRMATLKRLASAYPHYAAALDAKDRSAYITEVSKTWSTDPGRAAKVQAIYDAMASDWDATAS